MATNVEIKVRVNELVAVRRAAAALADQGPFRLQQVDHFFPVYFGRLKLRMQHSDLPEQSRTAELIAYQRANTACARTSDYTRCVVPDPECLRIALSDSLGQGAIVRKTRELYLVGRTRIHLDTVDGLGMFVELEVVLDPQELEAAGMRELSEIQSALGLQDAEVMKDAYGDMIASVVEVPE